MKLVVELNQNAQKRQIYNFVERLKEEFPELVCKVEFILGYDVFKKL